MPKMIIEIRGGLIETIYDDVNDLHITVVDWDNENDETDENGTVDEIVDVGLKRLPEETAKLIDYMESLEAV